MTTLGDLPADQARLWMHRVAGWVADYREKIEQQRVTPDLKPGVVAAALSAAPPEHGQPLAALMEDVERVVVPGIVHRNHPRFLDAVGSAASAPGILGQWLSAALNVSATTGRTSPAAAELETTTLRWIRSVLGIADGFEGVACDSVSTATLLALTAAREATGLDVRRRGLASAPSLMIYASAEAHGAVEKAAGLLGLGEASVRRVETDGELRMRPAALRAAVARDVHARLRPLAVVATVGTASSAAVDPVPAVADVCREHRLWLHVDATAGAGLAVLPEGRWVLDGVGRADSIAVAPHTWLFVPLDFTVLYTRWPDMLEAAVTPVAEDRRFQALTVWMAFRAFGRAGIEARIRENVRLARRFAAWVEADPDFDLAAPVTMAVVCFRASPAGIDADQVDALNQRLVDRVNDTGRVYLGSTRLQGHVTLRLAVGNLVTTEQHLEHAWGVVRDGLASTLGGSSPRGA